MVQDLQQLKSAPALLALHPKWAEEIICARKSVEVRRRPMRLGAGSLALLYATAPRSQVLGTARIEAVHRGPAGAMWRRFGTRTRLTREAYDDYLQGSEATCLSLGSPRRVEPLELGFTAPQSWLRLRDTDADHRALLHRVGAL